MKHLKLLLLFTLFSVFAYGQELTTLPSGSIQVQSYKLLDGRTAVGNAAKKFPIVAYQQSLADSLSNVIHRSGAEVISGRKQFTTYLKFKIDTSAGNPFFLRMQDETGFDIITLGEIGLANRAPAIKLIGRDLNDEPEFFMGHNEIRNYGWITQSSFGNATFVFNRRKAGVDYAVYRISNYDGKLYYNTTDTTHFWNVGGDANFQGDLSSDHLVKAQDGFVAGATANAAVSGAVRLPNNYSVTARNAGITFDIPLIKATSGNKVSVDENGFGIVTGGDISATQYKLSSLNTAPSSSTDTGTTGEIRITAGYIYVCTTTNTWVRAALTTW